MKRLKIYVGCALTKAPVEFREAVESLKVSLEKKHPEWEVLKFFGLGPSPKDSTIYDYDIGCVRSCDLMVAICDIDSIGLGIEIGVALEGDIKKPILFVAHKNWVSTRMVTGPCEIYPKRTLLRRYQKMEDVEFFIIEAIS